MPESSSGKVLLESSELVVRGLLRGRVPISALHDVSVQGSELLFQVAGESVAISLGASNAVSWAKAIARPPATLAAKLGYFNCDTPADSRERFRSGTAGSDRSGGKR